MQQINKKFRIKYWS